MTLQDAAAHAHLSWNTAKDIVKEQLGKEYKHIRLKDIKYLAIDEIYLGKRKNLSPWS